MTAEGRLYLGWGEDKDLGQKGKQERAKGRRRGAVFLSIVELRRLYTYSIFIRLYYQIKLSFCARHGGYA